MEVIDTQKIDYPRYQGISLPKIGGIIKDAGKVIQSVQDLKLGPNAVILATYPRSGTHWVYEMTNMLLQKKAEYSRLSREAVFVEGLPDPCQLQSYNHIISSHLPFHWLPKEHVETGGKIIYVIRNPKDVAVSLYKFLDSCGDIPSNETFEDFVSSSYLGELAMYGGWFDYNKAFLKASADRGNQIIVLQFEKLKKNTEKELRRLADFLGLKVEEQLLKEIAEKSEFRKLRKADEYVREDHTMSEIMKVNGFNERPTVYRKGQIGDWKNHFTVALNEEFEKEYIERMKAVQLDIDFE